MFIHEDEDDFQSFIILLTGIIGIIICFLCIGYIFAQPFTRVEVHVVNVTEVWLMNSGIMVWGYWDNSTVESCVGLFQSGFSHNDVGGIYRVHYREWPDENIRCLKLVKKVLIK